MQGRVFNLRIIQRHQLHHCGVQLVGLAHRGGAALQIADVGAFLGHDEGTFKLPAIQGVDAEVGHQFHRAADSLGNVGKGAVAEHGGVKGCIEIVGVGHHRTQILLHQLRVLLDRLANGAKDDPGLFQGCLVGGGYRGTVQHRIHGNTGQLLLLTQRDAQLVESRQQFRVNLVHTLGAVLLGRGGGIIDNVLEINAGVLNVGPGRFLFLEGDPVTKSLEPPFQHPFRFLFLGGNKADNVLTETLGGGILLDINGKAPFVLSVNIGRRAGNDPLGRH